jgi:hypothetical protein
MAEQTFEDAVSEKIGSDFRRLRVILGSDVTQLWSDASEFYKEARSSPENQPDRKSRLMRAAVLGAAAAFESTTNFLAEQVAARGRVGTRHLTEAEVDVLREKGRVLEEKGTIKQRKVLYSSKKRFLLLYRLISGGREYGKKSIDELTNSFEVRDRLVHPKPGASISDVPPEELGAAVLGFLRADLILTVVWSRASENNAGPTSGGS